MTVLTTLTPTLALPYERHRRTSLSRARLLVSVPHRERPMRRWVGHQLVRAGAWLANDPAMRPARAP